MKIQKYWSKRIAFAAAIFFFASVLSSCLTVRFISDYDESTDKGLTALQQSSDDFLAEMIAKAPSDDNAFDKHQNFYDDADKQLRRLEFRVGSIPKNTQTVSLVANIRTVLLGTGKCDPNGSSLRDIHCLKDNAVKGPSVVTLQIAQRIINQTIGAALALELAKKQESQPTSK